jgi:uncharacterized protein
MRSSNPASLLARTADRAIEWSLRHPRVVLIAAGAITLLSILFVPSLRTDVDFANYLNRSDPAVIAADEARARFGSQLRIIVMIEDPRGVFRVDTLAFTETLERALKALPIVREMVGPLSAQVIRGTETSIQIRPASPGGRAPATEQEIVAYRQTVLEDGTLRDYVVSSSETALAIYLEPVPNTEMIPFASAVEQVVNSHTQDGISVSLSGLPYVNLTLQRSMRRDLQVFLPLVILVIVGVLFFSFRWIWGVVIPFLVVALSVLWTVGLMAAVDVPITVLSFILPVLLMAIGIADGIHVLNRYREMLSTHSDKREALRLTMLAMKRPVVVTSLTTAVGFLSLLNAYMVPQRVFGLFTAVGILVAMVLSLLLIPAVLQLVPTPRRITWTGPRRLARGLGVLVGTAARHRWTVLVVALMLSAVFASAIPRIQIETSQRAFLGSTHPAAQSMDGLDRLFSGSNQMMIEVDSHRRDGLKDPELLHALVDLENVLRSQGVEKVLSFATVVREMNQRFHADDPDFYAVPESQAMVSQLLLLFSFQGGTLGSLALSDYSAGQIIGFHGLQSGVDQALLVKHATAYMEDRFEGLASVRLVGPTRIQASMFGSIARSQLTSLLTSIVAASLIVILLMRSIYAGLLSMIPLLLTVLLNFGIMAWFGKPLDIATLMISSITVGIGIDYGVHLIERIREEMLQNPLREAALVRAAQTTGVGILYNAAALALGFGVMALSEFQALQNFGLLIALTMVVCVTSAITVIPAVLARRLAGEKKEAA